MSRYFIDFEFIEDGRTIDPLSIGIVSDDGATLREFYAEFAGAELSKANDWVRAHVIPSLQGPPYTKPARVIREEVLKFVTGERPEFWGYYSDYDWVCLCQLFGRMVDLPKHFPMYCRDIKQFADDLGNPKLPQEGKDEHHALVDARWNRRAWQFLRKFREESVAKRLPRIVT